MGDEHKTREQLLEELVLIRKQLREVCGSPVLGSNCGRADSGSHSVPATRDPGDSPHDLVWDVDDFSTPLVDESTQRESPAHQASQSWAPDRPVEISKDVTESGSFDLRWLRITSFGKLLEAIPMPILLVNLYGGIELANKAFMDLARVGTSVVGRSFYALFPDPHEMGLAEKLLENVLVLRKPEFREGMLRLAENEIWCRMSLRSIRFGTERSVLVLIEDLTAEKRELLANEKFRKLVDVSPIGIAEFVPIRPIFCDSPPDQVLSAIPEARVTDGNIELARMLGRSSVGDMKGARLKDVFPLDEQEVHLFENWIRNRLSATSAESKEVDSAGEAKYYENTLVGIVQDRRLVQFWGMRQDITERKRVQEELIEKIRIIDELYEHILQTREAKAIAEHTAKVAHELRQPLAIIGGFARRMAKECEPCERVGAQTRRETFGIMIREVRRLEGILTGLIDFTQRRTVQLETTNPNDVIRYVLQINSERLHERSVKLEVSLGEDVGEIFCDRERFEQVVRNLLAHALEASTPGDLVRVQTALSCLSAKAQQTGNLESDTYFELKIYHRGKVVPEEDLRKLFNPFVTTRDYGTGIGLTIAKKIVEDHKGSISVNSEPEGTLFTVWLPLTPPEPAPSQ